MQSARARAARCGRDLAVHTRDMVATGHNVDIRAVVRQVASADLDLVGLALRGPDNAVAKVVKGTRLHPRVGVSRWRRGAVR